MGNIYEQVVKSFNQQIELIQSNNPVLLDMYFCLNKLQSTQNASFKERELKNAKELLGFSKKQKYTRILFGKRIDEKCIISLLKEKTKDIDKLHRNFEKTLVQTAKENGMTANHVLGGRIEDMQGEYLLTSKDRLTQFEQKKGNYLFATTLPISKKIYAIRQGGMRRLGQNSYLFWQNNNIDLKCGFKLKNEKTVFNLDIDQFIPETAFVKNNKGDYCLYFDDEWLSDSKIRVFNDKREPIVPFERINDISEVLESCKIYISQNDKLIAEKLRQKENDNQIERCLQDFIKNKEVIYVNELVSKNNIENIKEDAVKQYILNKICEKQENVEDSKEDKYPLEENAPNK